MFTNIVSALTSNLPKSLLFSSILPIVIFEFINGILIYAFVADLREQFKSAFVTTSVYIAGGLTISTFVFAYLLSSIQDFLRQFLEGRYVWPGWLRDALVQVQQRDLDVIERDYRAAAEIRYTIADKKPEWQREMREAAKCGETKTDPYSAKDDEVVVAVRKLEGGRISAESIDLNEIEGAVAQMCSTLSYHSIKHNEKLKKKHSKLLRTIDAVEKAAQAWELREYSLRQSMFGLLAPEPTAMGNVAAAIQSYAVRRYGIDLDTFWSRMQLVIKDASAEHANAIVDAKTQLDFMVSAVWLALLTGTVWWVLLAFFGTAKPFIIVAVVTPIAVYVLYRMAITTYLAYGAVVRAAIDLNRFDLLAALHLPSPGGVRDERELWSAIRRLSAFVEEDVELSYASADQNSKAQ